MLRSLKLFGCLFLLCVGSRTASAYSLLGPAPTGAADAYQVPQIAYMLAGDVGTPKNLSEGYRWNTPVVYYAFDQTFLDYFGSNGVNAVEQAISTLNALPPLSSLSSGLTEYPLRVVRENYLATTLGLDDLKSWTLELLVEELGLAQPQRFVWTLRNRYAPPPASCPFMVYHVIQRNFDPASPQYSSYVNGVLYDYEIFEDCTATVSAAGMPIYGSTCPWTPGSPRLRRWRTAPPIWAVFTPG